MFQVDFISIIREACYEYDSSREIRTIEDISAKVSTNHVYRIRFADDDFFIAKLSYFGRFEHFVHDHSIVNDLANNLTSPFQNFLAKSLTKAGSLFIHRHQNSMLDAWVVFYNPIAIDQKPAKKQSLGQIKVLGSELAKFHLACHKVRNTLLPDHKQMGDDINHLLEILNSERGQFEHRGQIDLIREQCHLLMENCSKIGIEDLPSIPVFVDWNIGNFSVDTNYKFFSRWDYDWFRMSTRVMDFYFFSRVCSAEGDKTIFSYTLDPINEDRFLIFLEAYHAVYPLTRSEILLIKEAYRFFILNYVIKDGRYFFNELYASRLQFEAQKIYFPQLETSFDQDKILRALNL